MDEEQIGIYVAEQIVKAPYMHKHVIPNAISMYKPSTEYALVLQSIDDLLTGLTWDKASPDTVIELTQQLRYCTTEEEYLWREMGENFVEAMKMHVENVPKYRHYLVSIEALWLQ